jgi:hypothetical protein
MSSPNDDLYAWMSKLAVAKIHFTWLRIAITRLCFRSPCRVSGGRWSFSRTEVERFRSSGKVEGPSALEDLLAQRAS